MVKKLLRPGNHSSDNIIDLQGDGVAFPLTPIDPKDGRAACAEPDETRKQGTEQQGPENSLVLPKIEPETSETIHVGAGGKLVVPREDFLADLDDGTEIDLVDAQTKKIRKPDRREWIALHRASELTTRLLLHKPKADGIEVEHYYVHPALRSLIRDELKDVRVFVYYSLKRKTYGLWVVNVTLDNSWYESLNVLFKQPPEFFASNAVRILSDKLNARYRVKFKPLPTEVVWPDKDTGSLLADALGAEHFVTSDDHPVYRDLIDGIELS
jgi:hypothetical protein